jgi:hypothetical protein
MPNASYILIDGMLATSVTYAMNRAHAKVLCRSCSTLAAFL